MRLSAFPGEESTRKEMVDRSDHMQLAMPRGEEETIRAFCTAILGLEEIAKPHTLAGRGGVWFRLADGTQLHFGVEDNFVPARKAHPGFVSRRLDDLASRLEAAGYPVIWDNALAPRRRFYTADPFGNRIEFLEPVH